MRISDWSSDVCSSDLEPVPHRQRRRGRRIHVRPDVGCDGGQVANDDLPGVAAPAVDQHLHLAAAAGGDVARKIRRDVEPRDYLAAVDQIKSEERRVGTEWVSKCRYWGSPYH